MVSCVALQAPPQCTGPAKPSSALAHQPVDDLRRELLWQRRAHQEEREEWLRAKAGMQRAMDRQAGELASKDADLLQKQDEVARLYAVLEQVATSDVVTIKAEGERQLAMLRLEWQQQVQRLTQEHQECVREREGLKQALAAQRSLNEGASGMQEEMNALIRKVVELTEENWEQEQTIHAMEAEVLQLHEANALRDVMLQKLGSVPLRSPSCIEKPAKGKGGLLWRMGNRGGSPARDPAACSLQGMLEDTLQHNLSLQKDMLALGEQVARLVAENQQLCQNATASAASSATQSEP